MTGESPWRQPRSRRRRRGRGGPPFKSPWGDGFNLNGFRTQFSRAARAASGELKLERGWCTPFSTLFTPVDPLVPYSLPLVPCSLPWVPCSHPLAPCSHPLVPCLHPRAAENTSAEAQVTRGRAVALHPLLVAFILADLLGALPDRPPSRRVGTSGGGGGARVGRIEATRVV